MDLNGKEMQPVEETDIYECVCVLMQIQIKTTELRCGFTKGMLGLDGGICSLSALIGIL